MIVFIIATRFQHVHKNRQKKSPEIIKKELLSLLLENLDENKLGLNKAARNINQSKKVVRLIKKIRASFKRRK